MAHNVTTGPDDVTGQHDPKCIDQVDIMRSRNYTSE